MAQSLHEGKLSVPAAAGSPKVRAKMLKKVDETWISWWEWADMILTGASAGWKIVELIWHSEQGSIRVPKDIDGGASTGRPDPAAMSGDPL